MRKVIFNPNEVSIDYKFTEEGCFAITNGTCPITQFCNLQIDENKYPRRSEFDYCPIMAKKMIDGTLNPTLPIQIYHHKKCGHYNFNDGRHRTCIAQHLHSIGINFDLVVYLYEPNDLCDICRRNQVKPVPKRLLKFDFQEIEFSEIEKTTRQNDNFSLTFESIRLNKKQ